MVVADTPALWTWKEVIMRPWSVENKLALKTITLCSEAEQFRLKKPKIRFDDELEVTDRMSEMTLEFPISVPIYDICSTLGSTGDIIGCISNESQSVWYMMHTVETLSTRIPQKSLGEALPMISGQHRLFIAASLACYVIQFHGNWLRLNWNSSDVQLATHGDGHGLLMDNLYISWLLSYSDTPKGPSIKSSNSQVKSHRLLSLGMSLVELSQGKPIRELLSLESSEQDSFVTKRKTASYLVEKAFSFENQAN